MNESNKLLGRETSINVLYSTQRPSQQQQLLLQANDEVDLLWAQRMKHEKHMSRPSADIVCSRPPSVLTYFQFQLKVHFYTDTEQPRLRQMCIIFWSFFDVR